MNSLIKENEKGKMEINSGLKKAAENGNDTRGMNGDLHYNESEKPSQSQSQSQMQSRPQSTTNTDIIANDSSDLTNDSVIIYDVEHLATFSTNGNHETNNRSTNSNDVAGIGRKKASDNLNNSNGRNTTTTPKVALQRLFELEKLSGIWTQHMQIELRDELMLIIDCETNSIVERFNKDCVLKPEAFNHYNDIYNNIVVFIIKSSRSQQSTGGEEANERRERDEGNDDDENNPRVSNAKLEQAEGELHIFQCVSHKAQQLVLDILDWKARLTVIPESEKSEIIKQSKSSSEKLSNNGNPSTVMNNSNDSEEKKNEQESQNSKLESNASKLSPTANGSSSATGATGKPVVTVASSASAAENVPLVNVNVKETVQVFNQIAALREKSKPSSPTNYTRSASDASTNNAQSTPGSSSNNKFEPVRLPLSPGGQLYKQRSIRATLAPKCTSNQMSAATSGASTSSSSAIVASDQQSERVQQNSDHQASSAASSSSLSELKPSHFHMNSHQTHNLNEASGMMRHQAASGMLDVSEHSKQVNSTHEQSTTRAGQLQSSLATSHHKSSKTQIHHHHQQQQQLIASSDSSCSHASSSSQSQLDQVSTNESYVSVLNHCFDDIEKFIIRLQQAVTAKHELQAKRKLSKRANQIAASSANPKTSNTSLSNAELALLSARARGPSEDDYFEILSKFKLAFNLLAKLKGCIHEPNAPELVHFLFTPLAIIIEAARNATPPVDPTLVGIPYLNQDALDLLSNCCTSKESDMWISLGPNWTQTIDMSLLKASRLPSSFQPIFLDGWAPIIGELELIGLVAPPSTLTTPVALNLNIPDVPSDVTHLQQHHHHHDNRRHKPYLLENSNIIGPSSAGPFSPVEHPSYVGKSSADQGAKSQAISSREYKKKLSSSHATLNTRHQDPIETSIHRSAYVSQQLNSIPYGYSDNPLLDQSEMHGPFRDHNSSSRRPFTSSDNHPIRRTKQNSRQPNYTIPTPNYADSSNYPSISIQQRPIDDNTHLEIDLLTHQEASRGLHSDDYSELHDHYVDERGLSKLTRPGPSHKHYSRNELTNLPGHKQRHQHNTRNSSSSNNNNINNNSSSSNRINKQQAASYGLYNQPSALPSFESDYLNESDQEAMLLDLGSAQTEWFYDLQARGALIVRVLFTRDANNDKELSVQRGEILEILDDTRKWWRARNIEQQVAHVPHTIVAVMHGYQTLDELLTNNPGNNGCEEPILVNSNQRYSRREAQQQNYNQQHWNEREMEKRNSRSSGAFRYF